jgi:hypothetical protein
VLCKYGDGVPSTKASILKKQNANVATRPMYFVVQSPPPHCSFTVKKSAIGCRGRGVRHLLLHQHRDVVVVLWAWCAQPIRG